MGFFTPGSKAPQWGYALPAIQGLEDWGSSVGLGRAGKSGKQVINQMMSGDYSDLAGTLLSPIHDQYQTQMREALRSNMMGANALMRGWQPGLMSAIDQDTRRKMAEGEGLAYGQAIPQLWGQAAGIYQNALNQQENTQLGAQEAALRGRIAASAPIQTPSTWQNIMGFASGLGQLI